MTEFLHKFEASNTAKSECPIRRKSVSFTTALKALCEIMKLLRFTGASDCSPNFTKLFAVFAVFATQVHLSYCWHGGYIQPLNLSTPEECARTCIDGAPPKNCYYTFYVEYYTTVGPACDNKEQLKQCIIADGVEKTLIPINRQLPGPPIQVCLGDRIIVDVQNAAPGLEIAIHWHGLFQKGTQYYDGVPHVTQCPIGSSSTFRYDFYAQNAGTHFYHSHQWTHMLDGQYGPLIIKPPQSEEPYLKDYDKDEHVMLLSDWMHELSLERFPGWYRHDLGQIAQNILINGRGNWTDPKTGQTTNANLTVFKVKKGLRYRFRVINSFSTVCLAELSIEKHNMTLIAQDGANVKPAVVETMVSGAGERADFILKATEAQDSYWIQVRGLGECSTNGVQQFAILQYEGAPPIPSSPQPSYNVSSNGVVYNSLDGTNCDTTNTTKALCVNQVEGLDCDPDLLKVEPDERHILDFWFFNYTEYGDRLLFQSNKRYYSFFDANDYSQLTSMFNDITYEAPASSLSSQRSSYQTICKPNQLSTCNEPCSCTQVIHTKLNSVVELVLYDRVPLQDLHHPFHLHGYEFKVFSIGQFTDWRNITKADINDVIEKHTHRLQQGDYKCPPGKDTVKIPTGGWSIIRFKATNPGWWLIHCHFTWHHITGMELVIHVGDKEDLPPVPNGFPKCDNWKPPLYTLHNFYGLSYPDYG